MSRESRRVLLAAGMVLHHRPYRDTSLIVEIFSRDHGRLTTFARGARAPRSRFLGLRPFQPLLLSWSGRGEAPQLTAAEPDGEYRSLPAWQLMSGYYLNELLIKLTAQHDPHPELYDCYHHTLLQLAAGGQPEMVLRWFERRLLEQVGFGIELTRDAADGRPVGAEAYYDFRPGEGVVRVDESDGAMSGRVLLSLARELPLESTADRQQARALMRAAIDHCLEGRELRTRKVAVALARAGGTGAC